jgi:hypothetical protein
MTPAQSRGGFSFCLFMQTGELREHPDGPKTKQIMATLKEIESSFPTARYIDKIRAGFAKQRALLEKQRNK